MYRMEVHHETGDIISPACGSQQWLVLLYTAIALGSACLIISLRHMFAPPS